MFVFAAFAWLIGAYLWMPQALFRAYYNYGDPILNSDCEVRTLGGTYLLTIIHYSLALYL
jgi:hypothetical protein